MGSRGGCRALAGAVDESAPVGNRVCRGRMLTVAALLRSASLPSEFRWCDHKRRPARLRAVDVVTAAAGPDSPPRTLTHRPRQRPTVALRQELKSGSGRGVRKFAVAAIRDSPRPRNSRRRDRCASLDAGISTLETREAQRGAWRAIVRGGESLTAAAVTTVAGTKPRSSCRCEARRDTTPAHASCPRTAAQRRPSARHSEKPRFRREHYRPPRPPLRPHYGHRNPTPANAPSHPR